MGLTP